MIVKLKSTHYINILLIFWAACLLSVNSSIDNNNGIILTFNNSINYLRASFPVIIFFILLTIFIVKPKKKINLFLIFYFIYAFWQVAALLIYDKEYFLDLSRIHIVVSLLATLLIIYYVNYFNKSNLDKLLFILIFFITLICIFFYSKMFHELITNKSVFYLYSAPSLEAEGFTLLQTNPRITGLSRMMVLILYFVFCFYTIKKKFFLLFILVTINYFIYASQSRGSFLGVLLLYLIYIFFFKEEKKRKLLIVFATFILPIILYESTLITKNYLSKDVKIDFGKNNRILYPPSINLKREINSYKNTDVEDLSTGRSVIWSRAFKIIKENKNFIGFGPQADRILLKKDKIKINPQERHFWDNNVSNGMLYSFFCGGIISLLLFILIYLLIFYEVYKSIFIKKIYHKNNNYIVNFSIITLLFLSLRSLFENSYAVFGIDSFFISITYSILYRFNNYEINLLK